MFDAETSALLRSAPSVEGLNADDIPALLTRAYANLASYRLGGRDSAIDEQAEDKWSLERIADTYELTATLQSEPSASRAAAFVSASAQQIIARRQQLSLDPQLSAGIDRERLNPSISAILLFLLSEQFADANEAATQAVFASEAQLYESTIVCEHILDLGRGRLHNILDRCARWRVPRQYADLSERSLASLLEAIATGIELFTASFLGVEVPEVIAGRFENANAAFAKVLSISSKIANLNADKDWEIDYAMPGPHHLASLLISTTEGIGSSSIMLVPPPDGADESIWKDWLRYRSEKFPFLWPNHRSAVEREFHETGVSSIVVLPTGAGKTTVSSLKIAGVLARGKKVVFLAPTHALVEQLTEDLQTMFPNEILGAVVSSDFDLLLQQDATFQDVEVMTPERCLAMLAFAPEAFKEVGLLVFDECHLLSPDSGSLRRALDGMLCVLGFHNVAPDADFLFLSAMVNNSEEIAEWLQELTSRRSIPIDLIWKPSRQARGVVIYNSAELQEATIRALRAQRAEDIRRNRAAVGIRAIAKSELKIRPYALWGLQHNWLTENSIHCTTSPLLSEEVQISGTLEPGPSIRPTPNANSVASNIAASAASKNLKTIIFVNTKKDAVKLAKDLSTTIDEEITQTDPERVRWDALAAELGDLKHSLLDGPSAAVPHNSAMLKLERNLAERMFKRPDGAKVIVATPTLAQGLNLPASLAILAGDKRASREGGRESLEAHEILNAAARAGRAGHLANGLVLLIPEPMIQFRQENRVSQRTIRKLKAVLPENDQCVGISDPLQIVLDRLTTDQADDADVKYTINRFAILANEEASTESHQMFDLQKSLAAHTSRKSLNPTIFEEKVSSFIDAVSRHDVDNEDSSTAILASQSGLSPGIVRRLKNRVIAGVGSLPATIPDWVCWMSDWLIDDEAARNELFGETTSNLLSATGNQRTSSIDADVMKAILDAALAWIGGLPLCEIETLLGGEPDSATPSRRTCPRARTLVTAIIPRGYSFALGLVAHVVKLVDPFDAQIDLDRQLVECMSTALRLGYDTPEKLFFANKNKDALGRVQAHNLWLDSTPD